MAQEFAARMVNSNATLSVDVAVFGDVFKGLFYAAEIAVRNYERHEIEALQEVFNRFCNHGLSDYARRCGGRDGEYEDVVHDKAAELRKFFADCLRMDRGFCAGSPPRRPRYTEGFVVQSWER